MLKTLIGLCISGTAAALGGVFYFWYKAIWDNPGQGDASPYSNMSLMCLIAGFVWVALTGGLAIWYDETHHKC